MSLYNFPDNMKWNVFGMNLKLLKVFKNIFQIAPLQKE